MNILRVEHLYWNENVCVIFRFIIHNCVPPIVLEIGDDPNEFEIPATQRRKVTETILETCRDSISDSLTGTCKDNFKVFLPPADEVTLVILQR